MEKNKLKTRLLIIACSMLVVVVILVVVIVLLNKNDDTGEDKTNVNSTETTPGVVQDIDISGVEEDSNASDSLVSDETNETTLTPTSTEAVSEPITVVVGNYKGIKTTYSPVTISDEDIDKLLNQLKSEYTDIIDMPDRPFENGDMAIVTYKGMVDGKVIEDLYAVCLQVILGRGTLPPTFEEMIIGKKKGDTFTIDMDYPEVFESLPEVAGKTVHFEVELVDGFVFDIPEINDEFIKKVTEYSTVEEYRTITKAELQKEQDDIAYEAAVKDIKSKIIENTLFSGLIENEIKKKYVLRINELNTKYQDDYLMDAATYYNLMYGISPEDYTNSVMQDVTFEVKYNLVLEEIAKAENISVEDAEKLILESAVIEGYDS